MRGPLKTALRISKGEAAYIAVQLFIARSAIEDRRIVDQVRLGLIGDVHAEDHLLARTLDALAACRVERILCTGDLVDGLGNVDRVVRLLERHRALVVRGNHDRWIRTDEVRSLPNAHRMTDLAVESIGYLKDLPKTAAIDLANVGGGRLLLCHGVGENDMSRLGPDDHGYAIASNTDFLALLLDPTIRVMVGGHTHKPMLRRFERAKGKPPLFVVNPGTLAREDSPGYAVLDLAHARLDFHRWSGDGPALHVSTAMLT